MDASIEKVIRIHEELLRNAILDSDVKILDKLLSDDLIFTNHLGQIMTKMQDMEAHQSGFVSIKSIEQSDYQIKILNDIVIVNLVVHIDGRFGDQASNASIRFTRVWLKISGESWQLIAAHSCLIG